MYSHHSSKGTNVAGAAAYKVNDVLMEKDGWRLVRPLYPEMLGCESYIVHMECRVPRRSVQSTGALVRNQCPFCGETPPDEIQGLEILHNGKI